jgi:hypothetical protein
VLYIVIPSCEKADINERIKAPKPNATHHHEGKLPCDIARAKSNTKGTATLALATVRELRNGAWVSLEHRHLKISGKAPPTTSRYYCTPTNGACDRLRVAFVSIRYPATHKNAHRHTHTQTHTHAHTHARLHTHMRTQTHGHGQAHIHAHIN